MPEPIHRHSHRNRAEGSVVYEWIPDPADDGYCHLRVTSDAGVVVVILSVDETEYAMRLIRDRYLCGERSRVREVCGS